MKKRKGFCLFPMIFILFFVVFLIYMLVAFIFDLISNPAAGNEAFKQFESELIEEYGIEYGGVFIDTLAIEVYFVTEEPISLEAAREITKRTRDYMLVDENYEPFLESYKLENFGEPQSVRIRFEPELSLQYYYQFSAPSFEATSWLFESYLKGEYYNEYYEIFDFVKATLFKLI